MAGRRGPVAPLSLAHPLESCQSIPRSSRHFDTPCDNLATSDKTGIDLHQCERWSKQDDAGVRPQRDDPLQGTTMTAIAAGLRSRSELSEPYIEDVIRAFVIATAFWGIAAFAVGVYVALQLAFPALNLGLEWTTFGRLRPVHTSAAIFAFGGNALMGSSLYVVQRTCRARLFGGEAVGWFLFFGYQLFIVLAALGYVFGITQSKEYAEPEWYVDLWLTLVWVVYLVAYVGTLIKREEPHIYVANWFYLAFIITIAMLHIVNNLAVPVSPFSSKSYSLFAGVQDALTQWWYGHNAVGFFLTAGFLAMMYYFIP